MLSSQASCVIVSGFRAALDLDTYPLRNLIRPRCAERAKPGRCKPVLIMHNFIGLFACFHAISRKVKYTRFKQGHNVPSLENREWGLKDLLMTCQSSLQYSTILRITCTLY